MCRSGNIFSVTYKVWNEIYFWISSWEIIVDKFIYHILGRKKKHFWRKFHACDDEVLAILQKLRGLLQEESTKDLTL